MHLKTDFAEFLTAIRPTQNQQENLRTGHLTLRARLNSEEAFKGLLVSDFLQGSYRRSTAVRPKGDRRSDVDIIIVTKLSEEDYTPDEAMALFEPFLEKYYKGKWRKQGRSFGIEMSYVEMDLVLTSAPTEAEVGILKSEAVTTEDDLERAMDWRLHPQWLSLDSRGVGQAWDILRKASEEAEWTSAPLRIPDRDANLWEDTHPLEQIQWTRDKNKQTDGNFINVVKSIKWWKLEKHEEPKHPKGFPLERIIGDCCPDDIESVADGVARTLETIFSKYAISVTFGLKPVLPDYGAPSHDVLHRVSIADFKSFYEHVGEAAKLARKALDSDDRTESGNLWRELFGNKFPEPPEGSGTAKGSYTPRTEASIIPGSGRFA